jgi:serine/threonine protein kinase
MLRAMELGRLLGEGATARVYEGPNGVAVKVLKPELARNPAVRTRFAREARAAAQVSHPRLAQVLDYGDDWLALPYFSGGSLADAVPLPLPRVAAMAADVAAGLDALHAAGIVHRDLKPSNILFDGEGRAHVADFGLAKDDRWTDVTADALVGTPHYLAPEIIAGSPPSTASDIYAFACVLWEAAAGAPPFSGRSFFDIGLAHIGEEPPDAGLPPDLDFALRTGLAKEPERRPATAHALATMVRVSSGARGPASS